MDFYKRLGSCLSLLVFLTLIVPAVLWADDWGHWRGPMGNGVSTEATPPTEWSDTKNVKWKVSIEGKGSGSPVVWGDRVFIVTAVATEALSRESDESSARRGRRSAPLTRTDFQILCFDRATGEKIWQQTAVTTTPHQGVHSTNNFASASPCTDGQHVYAFFGSRGLYCYTMDGQLVWKRDDFGKMETRNAFGEGSSPTISGSKIIVPWDHDGPSALYALDKLTGKTIWKTKRDEPTNWSTPLIVENGGQKQIVMNGQNFARGYDFESGEELWRCGGQTQRPCASAVHHDGMIYVGSGFRGSFLGAFRADSKGDIGDTKNVVWSVNRDTPDIASPLLSEGRIYYHKGKSGVLSCLDATTGEPFFSATRVPGLSSIYASPVAAGGYVFLTGRSGRTVVLKDGEEFEVVASNSVGETVDATPAPVGKQLFIRGEKHLFCIEE